MTSSNKKDFFFLQHNSHICFSPYTKIWPESHSVETVTDINHCAQLMNWDTCSVSVYISSFLENHKSTGYRREENSWSSQDGWFRHFGDKSSLVRRSWAPFCSSFYCMYCNAWSTSSANLIILFAACEEFILYNTILAYWLLGNTSANQTKQCRAGVYLQEWATLLY